MNARIEAAAGEIQAIPGYTKALGVRKWKNGYEFSIEVPKGEEASLVLYRTRDGIEERQEFPFTEAGRTGGILSLLVTGIRPENTQYNFCLNGQVIRDPYARVLVGTPEFGRKEEDPEKIRCSFKEETYSWTDGHFQGRELNDSIYYKLQVRSFTMHKNSKVRKKGTFAGAMQKIPYLKELGVTGVLLMPAYEYSEIMKPQTRGAKDYRYPENKQPEEKARVNCWGYTGDACYFAPKGAFSAAGNPVREFRDLVNALHNAGMECLMEFFFDRQTSLTKMLDILKYWKCAYHIDGFHLMGQGICRELFIKDPVLAGCKLFFHDVEEGIFGQKKVPHRTVAEYNEGFLYSMRHMLKGDENAGEEFLWRNKRNPACSGVINYLADQDGFSMMDMVSYEQRHNEANGENNQDGLEYNCTWNCGTEGPSRKQKIRRLRQKQLKNAFAMLFLAQGTPLIFQGDEWGNSQQGNNNVWCQDNEAGWIDWNGRKNNSQLLEFVKKAIAFRKEHGVLHMDEEPRNMDYRALGYPDLSYHGSQAWVLNRDSSLRSLGMMYCGDYGNKEREFVFAACNFHWDPHEIALPGMPGEIVWKEIMRTDREEEGGFLSEPVTRKEKVVEVPPRTIIILTGKQEEKACGSGNILRRLQGTSF